MGIQALPDTAIRALGSGQVLTDPVSLIKELLDNSLDALATSISIEVSQNTLDVLQVKDNGHGIPAEDHELMAMRHRTSKITDFEEIQNCRSLGFRGEALASAAELAGGLVITTMVEGEKVAMACTCDRVGKVTARKPVGAMRGTTVRVTDFFKFLPVRRENAIKGAQKSLSKVRTLLQRYYLSHPACRFSLRILAPPQKSKAAGGQSEDIVYAPSKSVSEAVMKAVGKEIVATCQWINTEHEEVTDGSGEQKIGIEAFMPKPGSDPAIICRKPQCTNFVFVDSRPVSCARGTLKQILSLYKSYLKSASPDSAISDPFLYLNLRCPPGAYDPNIEPAKDDVMFFHADRVIGAVEVIFKGLYGELKAKSSPGGSGGKGKSVELMTGGFELLLARKRDPKPSTTKPPGAPEIDEDEEEMAAQQVNMMMELDEDPPAAGLTPANPGKAPPVQTREESPHRSHNRDGSVRPPMFSITDAPSPGLVRPGELNQEPTPPAAPLAQMVQTPRRRPTNWGFNMSSGYDEDESDLALDEVERQVRSELAEEQADEAAARDIAISNPWTAAKMNSPASGSNQPFSPTAGLSVTKRTFRPPTVIDPPRNLRSSPQFGSLPSLHYSVTPVSSSRRMITMPPTPSGSSPSFPQGDTEIMQSWLKKAPRQSPQNAAPSVVHRKPINEDYDEDIDDEDEGPQRGGHQKPSSKSVPRVARDQQPKRRRLNDEREVDYDGPPPGYDDDPDFVRTQPLRSPHKNRFLKAAAALSGQVDQGPSPEPVEPEPRHSKPHIPPPSILQQQQPKKPRLASLDTPPPKANQTTNITKLTTCPITQLRASFSHLRTSDSYNRLVSTEDSNSSKGSTPPKATQGNVGIFFEIDNVPDDPDNSQVQQREKAIAFDVKRWMDKLAEERGVETEPFWLEFDHEYGPEGERSVWVFREGDSDGEDMEDEDEEY